MRRDRTDDVLIAIGAMFVIVWAIVMALST